MSARQVTTLVAIWVSLIAGAASAQHIVPSALLTIDQNRTTVVDRIVSQWGDRLARSNAGLSPAQLREILSGLRSDHLLAASLAGSVEGLRDVVSGALVHTDAAVSSGLIHTKSLGDTGDDLVYTPVVPCRILDTRNGTVSPYNSPMVGGSAFPVAASLSNFAPQGGSATSCNLPSSSAPIAAIAVTLTVLNPNFDAFLAASSSSDFPTLTRSVVMDFSANKGLANTAIVPVDGTVKFYLGIPAQVVTQVIADAVGYFRRPNNYAGTHTITGVAATDSGGANNTASGNGSAIGGGGNNVASGAASTVAGGQINTAGLGDASTVGGGQSNTASGSYSTVAGGLSNTASGQYSAVGGGTTNIASGYISTVAGAGNTASANFSTVAGGLSNTASGAYSTVAGGSGNTASGFDSTVAGGQSNTATGTFSFAAGTAADAKSDGCFVWGDNSNTGILSCLSPNEVDMRAMGGFFFVTGGTRAGGYTGAQLPGGAGAWTTLSDRSSKEHVLPVDARDVLRKIVRLPIATWNWTAQGAATRHMGPMAQDFRAAFGLGEDDRHISTVDAEGVALAAIQGLHQLIKQKDAKLRIQDSKLHEQSNRISTMERELATIKEKLGIH